MSVEFIMSEDLLKIETSTMFVKDCVGVGKNSDQKIQHQDQIHE